MVGANYMGGKRNAARARNKDTAGRMQKSHFLKQRNQILLQGLQESCRSNERVLPKRMYRAEDIELAHAKSDLKHDAAKKNHTVPRTPMANHYEKTLILPELATHKSSKRKSKVLETLDINDAPGLRATMDRLLRVPDLAGLSNLPSCSARRHRSRSSQNSDGNTKRRRQESESSAPSVEHSTRGNTFDSDRHIISPKEPNGQAEGYEKLSDIGADSCQSSLGFSVDRYSLRDIDMDSDSSKNNAYSVQQEPGTSYYDSGFSELQFSDKSESLETLFLVEGERTDDDCRQISTYTSKGCLPIPQSLRWPNPLQWKAVTDSSKSSSLSSRPMSSPSLRPLTTHKRVLNKPSGGKIISQQPASAHSVTADSLTFVSPSLKEIHALRTINLVEVDNPWEVLDQVLGLPTPEQQDKSNAEAAEFACASSRHGLGYSPSQMPYKSQTHSDQGRNHLKPYLQPIRDSTRSPSQSPNISDLNKTQAEPTSQELMPQVSPQPLSPISGEITCYIPPSYSDGCQQMPGESQQSVQIESPRSPQPSTLSIAICDEADEPQWLSNDASQNQPFYLNDHEGKLPTSSPTLSNSFVCPKPLTEISQDSLDDLSGSPRKFPAETSRSPCDKINVLSLEASAETVMFGGPDLFSGLDDDED